MSANGPQHDTSERDGEPGPSSKKLRAALLLAFGGLLTVMLAAGIGAFWRLRQLHAIEQQVSSRFLSHTQALSALVISVHIYDGQLERFLLEDEPAGQAQLGPEIASHVARAHLALRIYLSDSSPQEQQFLQKIEQELSEQERASSALLSLAPQNRRGHSDQFIHEQLFPRSLNILRISQQIISLNNHQFVEDTENLLTMFASLQTELKSMLLLALTAGLLLSVLGSFYILRLEQQGRDRYRALADSRLELEKLSARLVDAQEQERRSIARELHDEVGQTLEALLVGLGALSSVVPAEDSATRERINRVKSLGENSVKTVRDIALLLRPSMLDDLGLIPALEWHAREVSRRGVMEADVQSETVSEELPDDVKICVYRLVQEALNNAAAHASAKKASVSVGRTADKLKVEIRDDGQGFDSRRVRGLGLLGMEERVKRLGGTLKIESQAGHGTSVIAELPVPLAKSL